MLHARLMLPWFGLPTFHAEIGGVRGAWGRVQSVVEPMIYRKSFVPPLEAPLVLIVEVPLLHAYDFREKD